MAEEGAEKSSSRKVLGWMVGAFGTALAIFNLCCFVSGLNTSLSTALFFNPIEFGQFAADNLLTLNLATSTVYFLFGVVLVPYGLLGICMWHSKPNSNPKTTVVVVILATIAFVVTLSFFSKKAGESYGSIMKATSFSGNELICTKKQEPFRCGRKYLMRSDESMCVALFYEDTSFERIECWKKGEYEPQELK